MDESDLWRLVERRTVYEGRFVQLYQDVLEGPGAPEVYEHVRVSDGVRVVALDDGQNVVLVEDQFYLPARRMLHLPGGGLEPDEEPLAAARRELAEETGWRAASWEPLGLIHPLPTSTAARTHLFLARGLSPGGTSRDASEQWMTEHHMPLKEAVAMVRSGAITEAGSVTALLLAAQWPAEPSSRAAEGPA
jgi:ADP-ribose pyrophosphatase